MDAWVHTLEHGLTSTFVDQFKDEFIKIIKTAASTCTNPICEKTTEILAVLRELRVMDIPDNSKIHFLEFPSFWNIETFQTAIQIQKYGVDALSDMPSFAVIKLDKGFIISEFFNKRLHSKRAVLI